MNYKHILVAYDGSELAQKALQQAVDNVKEQPATRLTVLHVIHFPNVYVGEAFFPTPVIVEEDYYAETEAIVDQAKKAIEGVPNAVVESRQGFPAETVLEYAEEGGCDLIVMGSRGLGGIKELLLGSVSHAVVQKAKIPVLIVK